MASLDSTILQIVVKKSDGTVSKNVVILDGHNAVFTEQRLKSGSWKLEVYQQGAAEDKPSLCIDLGDMTEIKRISTNVYGRDSGWDKIVKEHGGDAIKL